MKLAQGIDESTQAKLTHQQGDFNRKLGSDEALELYINTVITIAYIRVKQRCYPMLWFKTFGNAEVTLSGIELANKIKKGQFDTSEIIGPGAMILQIWEAVLAA